MCYFCRTRHQRKLSTLLSSRHIFYDVRARRFDRLDIIIIIINIIRRLMRPIWMFSRPLVPTSCATSTPGEQRRIQACSAEQGTHKNRPHPQARECRPAARHFLACVASLCRVEPFKSSLDILWPYIMYYIRPENFVHIKASEFRKPYFKSGRDKHFTNQGLIGRDETRGAYFSETKTETFWIRDETETLQRQTLAETSGAKSLSTTQIWIITCHKWCFRRPT